MCIDELIPNGMSETIHKFTAKQDRILHHHGEILPVISYPLGMSATQGNLIGIYKNFLNNRLSYKYLLITH
jgi:hypothetical protein